MRYFNLFSNIFITKGASRILISDLQRNTSELYPLEFYEMIEELKISSIEDTLKLYDKASQKTAQSYLKILLNQEYGFITENDWDHNFPPLSHEYLEPNLINNLFIETPDIGILKRIKDIIDHLGIRHLVIYNSKIVTLKHLTDIENIFTSSVLEGIEVISPFYKNIDESFISDLNSRVKRIYSLIFYNCPQFPFRVKEEYRFTLQFVKENIKISSCGKVDLKYLNTNLPKVLEAINYNSCLHKKIGIDKNGNIKNCPLMEESFGNIQTTSLEEALNQPSFKKYWNLSKDHIEGCKDCEFRYVCTDCRAYTERSHYDDQGLDVSKPLKCGYNPYTNEWEKWSKNPLKQKAILHYNL